MSTPTVLGIILGVAALGAVMFSVAYWTRNRRSAKLRDFAAARHLSYMGDTWVLGDCGFSLFRKGERQRWRNVISGSWEGTTLVYADYEFTEREGSARRTYEFSTVVTDLGATMPVVEVTERSVAGDLPEQLGVHAMRFDSDEFSNRFVVESTDEGFALKLMQPRMVEALLGCPADVHVQFGPSRMVVWGQRRPPEGIADVLDAAARLDQRVPVLDDVPQPAA